jgi:cell wall-associated NlpC family hydrolase
MGSITTPSPSSADPSVSGVQARVDSLYRQAEVASERLNEARDNLAQGQARLRAVRADLASKRQQVAAMRQQVVDAVVAQSQGETISPATQTALSNGPDAFLQRLVLVSQYNDQQQQLEAGFATEARQLDLRRQAVTRELTQLQQTRKELAAQKATIEQKAAQAKQLLSHLKAQAAARQAAALAQASRAMQRTSTASAAPAPTTAPPVAAPASGRAGAAVAYAMSKVGDAYVWGGAGPTGFDCSGLTMMAWRQAGVSLPHSAAGQMSYGTPVSHSQLQPGDLVFYYSPVSHVGMYIGNGKIVNAENPSVGVAIAPVDMMPFAGAVRPG